MADKFKVTDHGLQIDKVSIKPGSELILGSAPPAHWSRFGHIETPKAMTVATPAAGTHSDGKRGRKAKRD